MLVTRFVGSKRARLGVGRYRKEDLLVKLVDEKYRPVIDRTYHGRSGRGGPLRRDRPEDGQRRAPRQLDRRPLRDAVRRAPSCADGRRGLDNAGARSQLEDMREQQRAISGVLRAVARSAGIQPVLDEVVEACERLCKAEYGALYLLTGSCRWWRSRRRCRVGRDHPRSRPNHSGRPGGGRTSPSTSGHPRRPEYSYGGPTEYYRSGDRRPDHGRGRPDRRRRSPAVNRTRSPTSTSRSCRRSPTRRRSRLRMRA